MMRAVVTSVTVLVLMTLIHSRSKKKNSEQETATHVWSDQDYPVHLARKASH